MASNTKHHAAEGDLGERATALAKDAGKALGEVVADRANQLGTKGINAAGEQLEQVTDKLTEKARRVAAKANRGDESVEVVSEKLHDAAEYLQETDAKDLVTHIHEAIVAHPYRTLAAGFLLGYLFSKKR